MITLTDRELFEQAWIERGELQKEIEVNNKKWYAIVENLDNLVDEQQFKIEALQARIKELRSDK